MLEHIEEKKRSMKAYAEGLLTVLKKGKITFRQLQLISVNNVSIYRYQLS
jgi:hypothetical protein